MRESEKREFKDQELVQEYLKNETTRQNKAEGSDITSYRKEHTLPEHLRKDGD